MSAPAGGDDEIVLARAERLERLARGDAEDTRDVTGGEPGGGESAVQVTDRFAASTDGQRQRTRQEAVVRNSSSSWSRAPLLLAPTSRLDTSPPENTSSVGMLMTS